MSRTASPATLDRRVRTVETEGVRQARMWLAASHLGEQSVHMALAVLISTQVRSDGLRGVEPVRLELL